MGKIKLTAKQEEYFVEISWAIGDGNLHSLKDIKGVPIPKKEIPDYMSLLVRAGLYSSEGEKYRITKEGMRKFRKRRDSDSKKVAAGRRLY
ncbi:MAG: hypothetical protein GTN36_06315 [Candidatus Aenigmarchaeota archaeon]|nr:hypothetical protein [Candidatus Aenigmarchaeota archaeon]